MKLPPPIITALCVGFLACAVLNAGWGDIDNGIAALVVAGVAALMMMRREDP